MGVAGGHHLAQVVRVPTGLEDGADGAGSTSGAPDVGTAAVPGAALTAAGAHVGHVGGMVAGDEVVEADAVRLVAGMTQQHPVWEEAEVMLPNPPVGGHTRTVEPLRQAKRPYPSSPRALPATRHSRAHAAPWLRTDGGRRTSLATCTPGWIYHGGATRPVPAEEADGGGGSTPTSSPPAPGCDPATYASSPPCAGRSPNRHPGGLTAARGSGRAPGAAHRHRRDGGRSRLAPPGGGGASRWAPQAGWLAVSSGQRSVNPPRLSRPPIAAPRSRTAPTEAASSGPCPVNSCTSTCARTCRSLPHLPSLAGASSVVAPSARLTDDLKIKRDRPQRATTTDFHITRASRRDMMD